MQQLKWYDPRRWWAAIRRVNLTEPARLRAAWVALAALLASLGLTVSTGFDAKVEMAINLVAFLLPLIQGESTRGAVYSPATFHAATRKEV